MFSMHTHWVWELVLNGIGMEMEGISNQGLVLQIRLNLFYFQPFDKLDSQYFRRTRQPFQTKEKRSRVIETNYHFHQDD